MDCHNILYKIHGSQMMCPNDFGDSHHEVEVIPLLSVFRRGPLVIP